MLEVRGCEKFLELDSFQDGCKLESGRAWHMPCCIQAKTLADLLRQLACEVPFKIDADSCEVNACDESGRIDVNGMENDDAEVPTAQQMQDWKAGKIDLWYVTYVFQVEEVTRHDAKFSKTTIKKAFKEL